MKFKRIVIIVICALLLVASATGCTDDQELSGDVPSPEAPATNGGSDTPDPGGTHNHHEHRIDYDEAFKAFEPDTVMLNTGGLAVTWAELFLYIRRNLNETYMYFGEILDWSEVDHNNNSFADYILYNAVEDILDIKLIEYGAALHGVTLGEEAAQIVSDTFSGIAEMYGGEEAFLKKIWEDDGCWSAELMMSTLSIDFLTEALMHELFGKDGEHISEDDLVDFSTYLGFVMAKHILLRVGPSDDRDAVRERADDILRQLHDHSGTGFEEYFDELMFMYSEDTGLAMSPNGYLFQAGDMVQAFEDAAFELNVGELSGVVESSFGYHIILRTPIDYDEIPTSGFMMNDYRVLREHVMMALFNMEFFFWRLDLEIEYTDAFRSIDMGKIFALCDC